MYSKCNTLELFAVTIQHICTSFSPPPPKKKYCIDLMINHQNTHICWSLCLSSHFLSQTSEDMSNVTFVKYFLPFSWTHPESPNLIGSIALSSCHHEFHNHQLSHDLYKLCTIFSGQFFQVWCLFGLLLAFSDPQLYHLSCILLEPFYQDGHYKWFPAWRVFKFSMVTGVFAPIMCSLRGVSRRVVSLWFNTGIICRSMGKMRVASPIIAK